MVRKAIVVLAVIFVLVTAAEVKAAEKFNRVWVLAGGGFRPATFVGMVDVAIEKGVAPEVVVGTCGANLSLFLLKLIPDPTKRLAYMISKEFHRFLLQVVKRNELFGKEEVVAYALPRYLSYQISGPTEPILIPDLYNNFLMFAPKGQVDWTPYMPEGMEWNHVVNDPPSSDGIRIVSVTTRLLFAPEEANTNRTSGRKLFREVIFTDKDTAERADLASYPNPIAGTYPKSTIDIETEVIIDQPLWAGVRASFSNPFLINPIEVNGEYYMNGSSDMYAGALGKQLLKEGGELVRTYNAPQVAEDQFILWEVLGMDMNDWHAKEIRDAYADRWIDISDHSEPHKQNENLNPHLGGLLSDEPIVSGIPKEFDKFVAKIEAQYAAGRERAEMALSKVEKNDKSHIWLVQQEAKKKQEAPEEEPPSLLKGIFDAFK